MNSRVESGGQLRGDGSSRWTETYLGHVVKVFGGSTPSKEVPEYWEGEIPWVSPKDMKRDVIDDSEDHISARALRDTSLVLLPPPAVLLVTRGMILNRTVPVAITSQPVTVNQDMKALLPRSGMSAEFLAHLLRANEEALLARVEEAGHGTRALRTDLWRKLPIVIPPTDLQSRIVAFLDRKTAAIDALVAKKERLIELLQEKRQALITQAVTKGLDPNVPMKDSGDEWLGKIPQSWTARPLKRLLTDLVDCPHSTPDYDEEGEYLVVRTADIEPGRVRLGQIRRCSAATYRERVARLVPRSGAILYSREGERFGIAALVPVGTPICLGQRMMQFRAGSEVLPEFLMWALNSHAASEFVKVDTVGATSPRVNIPTIAEIPIAFPPLPEQQEIVDWLGKHILRIDGTVDATAASASLLREYRQALISAAVTGKIELGEVTASCQR